MSRASWIDWDQFCPMVERLTKQGHSVREIARRLQCHHKTVSKARQRLRTERPVNYDNCGVSSAAYFAGQLDDANKGHLALLVTSRECYCGERNCQWPVNFPTSR